MRNVSGAPGLRIAAVAVLALVAGAALTPALAQANAGDPVVLGASHTSSRTTYISATGGHGLQIAGQTANTALLVDSIQGTGIQGTSRTPGASGVLGVTYYQGAGVTGKTEIKGTVGVRAQSATGTALEVLGKMSLSRSGKAVVKAGQVSIIVTGVDLSAASAVQATPQTYRPGVWVAAAVPAPAKDSIRIYLSKAPRKAMTVAWFVLN
jgi:hypothetical protein